MIEDLDMPASQELDIEELYSKVQPAKEDIPSVAAWLVPILDKNKTRIINLSRNSELDCLSAERITKELGESKFSSSNHQIKPPEALIGHPGLQEVWDGIHQEYQTKLTQYVTYSTYLKLTPNPTLSPSLTSK